MPNDLVKQDPALSEVVARLVEAYQPERIYLFGSKARGEAGVDSDYDLLVVVPDDSPPERRRSRLAYDVLWGTGTAADVVVWTRSLFEEPGASRRRLQLPPCARELCSMPHDPAFVAETQSWLRKARTDLDAGAYEMTADPPFCADVAFHAQQAAEKAIKAFLTWHAQTFRKTHNLVELGQACAAIDSSLESLLRRCVGLTEYAWKFRYPGESGDAARRELLMELRLSLDRRTLPGLALLRLEWLLLQDPRARFSPARPRLPGQKHPGLGLLQDVSALLLLACERLQLDGLLFVPSHYHLASQGKRWLRFLDPEHEGLFRSLAAALHGLPLAEATNAVVAGRVTDAATGERFSWRPMAMVLPVTAALHERVSGDDYERRADEAAAQHRFVVRARRAR